jgi:hypothetical protein
MASVTLIARLYEHIEPLDRGTTLKLQHSQSVVPPMRNTGIRARVVRILSTVAASISAEPMPFDCEHIVDSGLGWLISMEK